MVVSSSKAVVINIQKYTEIANLPVYPTTIFLYAYHDRDGPSYPGPHNDALVRKQDAQQKLDHR